MRHTSRTRSLLLLLAAGVMPLAGCGDDDDPVSPVETFPVAAARLEALADSLQLVTAKPVFGAFLGVRLGRGLPMDDPFVPFAGDSPFAARMTGSASIEAPASVAAQRSPATIDFTIPDSLRGLTFVRDPIRFMSWRRDTLPNGQPTPGAPASGVRFVLLGPTAGFDAESEERVGHMDLLQEGSGTTPKLITLVYDLAGTLVQRYEGAPPVSGFGTGWTTNGTLRIDETTSLAGRDGRQTWTSSAPVFTVRRSQDLSGGPLSGTVTHALTVDGQVVSLRARATGSLGQSIFTVLVGDAPFAWMAQTFGVPPAWRHSLGDRPLTEAEQAQVNALVHVLASLPDAMMAWSEAQTNLYILKRPGTTIFP